MEGVKMRLKCLKLAQAMTYDPEAALRLSLAFEGYVTCGFNTGMGLLTNPPVDPVPAAPLSAGQVEELDRSLAGILDAVVSRLH